MLDSKHIKYKRKLDKYRNLSSTCVCKKFTVLYQIGNEMKRKHHLTKPFPKQIVSDVTAEDDF